MQMQKNKMDKEKICIQCGKEIPEHRIKKFRKRKRKILTCSKKCSNNRSLTSSKNRNNYRVERGLRNNG